MRSAAAFLLVALLLAAAAGCSGSRTGVPEARENPDDATGDRRTVLRGTAMRAQSSMGSDLLETLRAANQNPTTATPGAPEGTATPPRRFNTLLTALDAAGLTDTLQSEGPYTLFAPSDDAFRSFSTDRLETLLRPENRQELRRFLSYHLVEGNLMADELAQRSPIATLAGSRLTVEGEGRNISVRGAQVLQANVGTSNGTIHVIDGVLVPPALRR